MVLKSMIDKLKTLLGTGNYLDDPTDMATYLRPWRGEGMGEAVLVALPKTAEEVAAIVKHCAETGTSIIPQAGNTGLVDGSLSGDSNAIILSTSRMRNIREVNKEDGSMVVEAGVTLAAIQEAASGVGKLFPLSMASEGSAMLGGMVATNPGGTAVLRYGNFRDLVLGREMVLPNGEIYSDLRTLRKNNAGYDLKNLFIGSEGTLGICTAAALKLFPQPKQKTTAFLAVDSMSDALSCFGGLSDAFGGMLTGFEMLSNQCVEVVGEHMPDIQFPLNESTPYYLLIECSSELVDMALNDIFEQTLAGIWETGAIKDAVIAASEQQAENLWALRENISESARHFGKGIHFDIAVPVGQIATFIDETNQVIADKLPDVTTIAFGHMGDGNIHYNQYLGKDTSPEQMAEIRTTLEDIIYGHCMKLGGTISAEHGVGTDRQEAFYQHTDPALISLMQQIKQALDPKGVMNPGKVLK